MKSKLVTELISALIALAVWVYVVTVVSPNSDKHFYNVPVVAQGEALLTERGLMITHTDVTTTDLHLEGSRIDLNKLSSSNITATMDVSKIYEAGVHNLTYTPTFPGDVPSSAFTVLSKNPGVVKVTVEDRISKVVPLEIRYTGSIAEDFIADKENIEMSVEGVTVTGPKSVVDQIKTAVITLNIDGRNESLSDKFAYTLCDAEGLPVNAEMIVTDVAEVSLTLRILRVKEIELKVNVIEGGGATNQNCVITIDQTTIRISGSDVLLEGLNSLELGTVNLGELTEETTLTFPIKLPAGVNNETGVTEVTVQVSFPELETKKFTVKNIVAVNVPQGYELDLITKALEVLVRGPKENLDRLTEADIIVTVDFTGVEPGTVKVKVQIHCEDPLVGAVGAYTVSAVVKAG
jgi:YbbR domain-containing protein